MIIYVSQPFPIYNWAWKPKTNLDICTFFLLVVQNNLKSYSEAAKYISWLYMCLNHFPYTTEPENLKQI